MSDVISNFVLFLSPSVVCTICSSSIFFYIFFHSCSYLFSLLHYCFLCILIFTKCQSNDEMPKMRKAKNEKEKEIKSKQEYVSSAHRKETCVWWQFWVICWWNTKYECEAQMYSTLLKKFMGFEFLDELLTTTGDFFPLRSICTCLEFVCICRILIHFEVKMEYNRNPWSVSNVNSNSWIKRNTICRGNNP